MKLVNIITAGTIIIFLASGGCADTESIDTEYPVIDVSGTDAFPQQCSVLEKGQSFTFRARFTDNLQLGGFSLDIHNNFDHHSHSTEVDECDLGAVKTPVMPMMFIRNYTVPAGLDEYEAEVEIDVPADVDSGDYHFLILLTDKEGWQTMRGLSIKIQ